MKRKCGARKCGKEEEDLAEELVAKAAEGEAVAPPEIEGEVSRWMVEGRSGETLDPTSVDELRAQRLDRLHNAGVPSGRSGEPEPWEHDSGNWEAKNRNYNHRITSSVLVNCPNNNKLNGEYIYNILQGHFVKDSKYYLQKNSDNINVWQIGIKVPIMDSGQTTAKELSFTEYELFVIATYVCQDGEECDNPPEGTKTWNFLSYVANDNAKLWRHDGEPGWERVFVADEWGERFLWTKWDDEAKWRQNIVIPTTPDKVDQEINITLI